MIKKYNEFESSSKPKEIKTLKKYKPTVVVECFYKEFFQIKKILKKIGYESYKFSNNGNLIKIYRPNKFEANIIFLPS